ncbi:hypothetical protein NQ318_004032 [Aromia moschata]|uniref:Uncharacterized protein n=1 Tax=Aromia moschata TaxID=1265417 RepID=A0AAV8ZA19_9CUCU|nr:hypothetical protein NQ318_004032 [Aromia moschata]
METIDTAYNGVRIDRIGEYIGSKNGYGIGEDDGYFGIGGGGGSTGRGERATWSDRDADKDEYRVEEWLQKCGSRASAEAVGIDKDGGYFMKRRTGDEVELRYG